jgi:hypothetical protein
MSNSLCIAVAQSNEEPWLSIWKNGQEKTWLNNEDHQVKVINFQSKSAPFIVHKYNYFHEKNRYRKKIGYLQGLFDKIVTRFISRNTPDWIFNEKTNLLSVNSWSTYQLIGRRYAALYEWFLRDTDYDFLFTTTTSCYINKGNLLSFVQELSPHEPVNSGYLMPENESVQFVSGAGRLYSRKTVELIRSNWKKYEHNNLEDVAHSDFLRKLGVFPKSLPRIELQRPEDVFELTKLDLSTNFFYRCKSSDFPRKDVEIMQNLHLQFQKIGQIE